MLNLKPSNCSANTSAPTQGKTRALKFTHFCGVSRGIKTSLLHAFGHLLATCRHDLTDLVKNFVGITLAKQIPPKVARVCLTNWRNEENPQNHCKLVSFAKSGNVTRVGAGPPPPIEL